MRYLDWEHHKTLIRNFIYFIFGIYIGMFICLYYHGQQIDQLMTKNNQITKELDDTKNELATYEKEEKQREKKQLIRTIKFHFEEKLDPYIETELMETLMDEMHFLIGKKIEDVNKSPDFVYQLLNKKTFKSNNKSFEIRVKFISIQSTIEIWLSAKEQKIS